MLTNVVVPSFIFANGWLEQEEEYNKTALTYALLLVLEVASRGVEYPAPIRATAVVVRATAVVVVAERSWEGARP